MKNSIRLMLFATLLSAAGSVLADECTLTIESNDMMQFNTSEMRVPASCSEVTVTMKHTGSMDESVMGHNWVLAPASDWQDVATKGMSAGADNEYVDPADDRVIAHTEVIGGGEETSVTFSLEGLEAGGDYQFFCSFPGHYAVMNGKFILE